jgi:hypothetical protein
MLSFVQQPVLSQQAVRCVRSVLDSSDIVQQALLLDVQLTLSKLGDAAQAGKFDNMSLAKLAEEIEQIDPSPGVEAKGFHQKLIVCLADFADKSKLVRDRRNKFLAHLDYDVALDLRPKSLEGPTRSEIDEALKSVTNFMWTVEGYFGEAITVYHGVATVHDGNDVVNLLKRAQRYFELVKAERIERDDWRESPWADA